MIIPVGKRYGDARWKGLGMGDYECTNCYAVADGDHRIYCPNCGAQMYICYEEYRKGSLTVMMDPETGLPLTYSRYMELRQG